MARTERSTSPRARRSEGRRSSTERRALILDAAIEVFAEKGFHDTRISDIAQRAGIAYGLVYHYFKNKDAILDTVFLDRWGEFMAVVRAIATDTRSVEEKLLSIAAVILATHRERPEWVKVLIFEIQRTQRMLQPERVEVIGELFRVIAGIIENGQARGELRPDVDPALASSIFVGGIDIVLTSRFLDLAGARPEEEDQAAYHERVARTVVDLFLRGMNTDGE